MVGDAPTLPHNSVVINRYDIYDEHASQYFEVCINCECRGGMP